MNIINEELTDEIKKINETFITIQPSLNPRVTNSIYYTKLKYLMFNEIVKFCKEKLDLRQDLLTFRSYIGDYLSEEDIREFLDELKQKYTNIENIGLDYHIETTRYDYGVCVFCIIKRGDNIYCKKFIFRFRKNPQTGLEYSGISQSGAPMPDTIRDDIMSELRGDDDV